MIGGPLTSSALACWLGAMAQFALLSGCVGTLWARHNTIMDDSGDKDAPSACHKAQRFRCAGDPIAARGIAP